MDLAQVTPSVMAHWDAVPKPGSYATLFADYGNPSDDGFEDRYIVAVPHTIAGGQAITVRCHVALVDKFHRVFAAIQAAGIVSQIKSYDGCYVVRDIRGNSNPSLHSWGLAIDLNASTNELGCASTQPGRLIEIFNEVGFFWGGGFYHRRDPMHFQWTQPHTI